MNPKTLSFCTLALLVFSSMEINPSFGQEQEYPEQTPVYLCENGDDCQQVDPLSLTPMQPDLSYQAQLDWIPYETPGDPSIDMPGTCAQTKPRILSRFENYIHQDSKIPLLGVYQWRGQTNETAIPIMEQLLALPTDGHWERTQISSWMGNENQRKKIPVSIRWTNGQQSSYFVFRKVDECYFLEFTAQPRLFYQDENIRSHPYVTPDYQPSPEEREVIVF